ncbi:MAG: hydrolase [Pseudomonadota bacterium]|jgi:glutamate carboxypeptidase|uniref:hydrolase n=1 Tax=Sphingobium yanoikuyae TaxID=13690 RepID=UPI001377C1F1|nr:hydrolase [Sphingobium yanoikuyae]NBB38213.1 hydrolase [Sphingobium yanoikuyae]
MNGIHPPVTAPETALLEQAAAAPMLAQVEAWASVNSGSRNLTGLAAMATTLADAFSALPGAIDLIEPDPVETVALDGRISVIRHGQHLRLTVRPDAPVQLLLTGHMDTVFPPDHAFQTLHWLEPGVLNGPGVADMKGGIGVMLAALTAIEHSEATRTLGYQVVINSDEEVGSPSSAALLRQAAAGKRAAFTYEPALPDGTLAGARAGSGNFSIIVTGLSAHAGRNPDDGRNALLAAADLALRLKAGSGSGFSCNPAKIDGGSPNNVVPDHAVLRVNFRPRSPDDEIAARALLDRAMADVARDHGVSLHLHGGFGRPPKPMDAKAERLFGLVRRCGADLGLDIGWRDTGGVCDGNNIAACGVPVVDTMGVRGGSIHSDAEFLISDSLAERAQLSALALLRIAQGQY